MDDEYLEAIQNSQIDIIIDDNIPTILLYLNSTYNKLTQFQLQIKEDNSKSFVYDSVTPNDTAFNKIEQFQDLVELVKKN